MSDRATLSRPAGKTIGAAVVGLVLTLAIFVGVFLTFLIAPLAALALAYLGYAAMRSRESGRRTRTPTGPDTPDAPTSSAAGFGAGAR